MNKNRLRNEIEHSKFLLESNFKNWGWDTPIGKLRLQRRCELLTKDIPPGTTVLEIGCGAGHFSKLLLKKNIQLTSIDISPFFIEYNAINIVSENIIFKTLDAHATNLPDQTFDFIVGCSVLHHLDHIQGLREFFRLLKPQGKIFFSEPNMINPHIALQKNIPWLKKLSGDSQDETAFIRWNLSKDILKVGFKNVEITPFDFLYPMIPLSIAPTVNKLGHILEKTPILKEFAGSLFISAEKV